MKFRKKPVEVEAIQLTTINIREVYSFVYTAPETACDKARDAWDQYVDLVRKEGLKLKTLESDNETQTAAIGDYIIRGVQGEFYPCKPDIFLLTYDAL